MEQMKGDAQEDVREENMDAIEETATAVVDQEEVMSEEESSSDTDESSIEVEETSADLDVITPDEEDTSDEEDSEDAQPEAEQEDVVEGLKETEADLDEEEYDEEEEEEAWQELRQDLSTLAKNDDDEGFTSLAAELMEEVTEPVELVEDLLRLMAAEIVGPKSGKSSGSSPKPGSWGPPADLIITDEGFARLFLSVGRMHGVRPGDVVGAIAGESGLPGKIIGSIDIFEKFTFLEVEAASAQEVLNRCGELQIRGNSAELRPATERSEGDRHDRGRDRGGYGDQNRGGYGNQNRGGYGNQDRGGSGGQDRGGYGSQNRGGYGDRNRGGSGGQDRGGQDRGGQDRGGQDRGGYGRQDRGGYGREERGGYGDQQRGGYGNRDRGGYGGGQRGGGGYSQDYRGSQGRGGYGNQDRGGYGGQGRGGQDRGGYGRQDRGGYGGGRSQGGYGRGDGGYDRERSFEPRERREGGRGRVDRDRNGPGMDLGNAPEPGMARLFVSIGRNSGVRPSDLVGAITATTGLPGTVLGAIEIKERVSFIEVKKEAEGEILSRMGRSEVRGHSVEIKRAVPMSERESGGRWNDRD